MSDADNALVVAVAARVAALSVLTAEQRLTALVNAVEQGIIFDGRYPTLYSCAGNAKAIEIAATLIAAGGCPNVWAPDGWPGVTWLRSGMLKRGE